ncbi:MAG: YicC/YloC family endoribonuclease [Coxiellaceae bacterium]|nr:YicC/YloC family endoribonuclease [Coxiellaceae bacterium]
MISSMTGFAKTAETADFGAIDWEIRSVNHRYLEIFTRLPDPFRSFETAVRTLIQKYVKRGKIDVVLQFSPNAMQASFDVDQLVLTQLNAAVAKVKTMIPDVTVNALDVLRWNQVMKSTSISMDSAEEILLSLLEKALGQFVLARQREGQALRVVLLSLCGQMEVQAHKISERLPEVMAHERKRIMDKFTELAITVDAERLEQEMVWIMQKADIAEELQRLQVHITEVRRVLMEDSVVGRRLDFLMQELNREVNTMASKSLDGETTQATVEMKVQIEQLREQVQNLE